MRSVKKCVVVGVPDKANLEKPQAFVVLKDGQVASSKLENELQEFVRSKTARYKYPRQVFFVEELPRTSTGKIQRFKLKNRQL